MLSRLSLMLLSLSGSCLLFPQLLSANDGCGFAVADVKVYQYQVAAKERYRDLKQSLFLIKINRFDRETVTFGDAAASPVVLYAVYSDKHKQASASEYPHSFAEEYLDAPEHYPTQAEGFLVLAGHEFFIDSLTLPEYGELKSGELKSLQLTETGFNPFFKKRLLLNGEQFVMLESAARACRVLTDFIDDYRAAKQYLDARYKAASP